MSAWDTVKNYGKKAAKIGLALPTGGASLLSDKKLKGIASTAGEIIMGKPGAVVTDKRVIARDVDTQKMWDDFMNQMYGTPTTNADGSTSNVGGILSLLKDQAGRTSAVNTGYNNDLSSIRGLLNSNASKAGVTFNGGDPLTWTTRQADRTANTNATLAGTQYATQMAEAKNDPNMAYFNILQGLTNDQENRRYQVVNSSTKDTSKPGITDYLSSISDMISSGTKLYNGLPS